MSILSFEKPKKILSTEEHNERYSSDTNIAGTYVPNMSQEDRLKWKAKKIGGPTPRVEIRKTVMSAQVLLIVYKTGLRMSANGRMIFDNKVWEELQTAVKEARELL